MPIGALQVYSRGVIDGEVVYETAPLAVRLGGLSNPTTQSVILTPPVLGKPKLVLLELTVKHTSPTISRWRLWLNGVAITREFKPNYSIKLKDTYYSKCVFDVTPIFDWKKRQHHITIRYEGSDILLVEHVGMVVAYEAEKSKTSYAFASGLLALSPGESTAIKLDLEPIDSVNRARVETVLLVPSRLARVKVESFSVSKTINGVVGVEEIEFDIPTKPTKTMETVVTHYPAYQPYYPRHVLVTGLLVSCGWYAEPKIVVEPRRHNNTIELVIRNEGAAKPEKLMIVAVQAGSILVRKFIEPPEPGEEKTEKLELPVGVLVRVVWTYHGRTKYVDLRP